MYIPITLKLNGFTVIHLIKNLDNTMLYMWTSFYLPYLFVVIVGLYIMLKLHKRFLNENFGKVTSDAQKCLAEGYY